METDIRKMITEEEDGQIRLLVSVLSKLCNEKIPEIMEEEGLESLEKFDITTLAISLQFGCEKDVFEELMSRYKKDDENLTYIG